MWETTKIEELLEVRLKTLGSTGNTLFARYTVARSILLNEILPWIRSNEPSLSDHGPEHIRNVLNNAFKLLGEDKSLNDIELYLLCQAILFHDVGNIFKRSKHNQNISKIYGAVFNGLWLSRQEMSHVVDIGRSHTGLGLDKTTDTIKGLARNEFFLEHSVNLQTLAALVRLADELAEGPQRTSSFMLEQGMFPEASEIFHQYASVTHMHIDKGNGRLAVSYHINIDEFGIDSETGCEKLANFLSFIYTRIVKLDEERRYCKHYCSLLETFKRTSIVFNFWNNTEQIDTGISNIELDDLILPGSSSKDITVAFPAYEIKNLTSILVRSIEE